MNPSEAADVAEFMQHLEEALVEGSVHFFGRLQFRTSVGSVFFITQVVDTMGDKVWHLEMSTTP